MIFMIFILDSRYVYAITTTGISKDVSGAPTELNQLHRDDANWMLEHSTCLVWLLAIAMELTASISLLTLIHQTPKAPKAANQNPAEAIVS